MIVIFSTELPFDPEQCFDEVYYLPDPLDVVYCDCSFDNFGLKSLSYD